MSIAASDVVRLGSQSAAASAAQGRKTPWLAIGGVLFLLMLAGGAALGIVLQPSGGTLSVESKPPGAQVSLDGVAVGTNAPGDSRCRRGGARDPPFPRRSRDHRR